MNLTYHVFLRSKTVDSDWSFFVLPGNFSKVKVEAEGLLKIITDIYGDDEIRNVTQKEKRCFLLFPTKFSFNLHASLASSEIQ